MEIPVYKTVKVSEHNGTLRMSIPNMIHTITGIEDGSSIIYNSMDYEEKSNKITIVFEIKEKTNNKKD